MSGTAGIPALQDGEDVKELSFLERPAVTAAEIMRHCGVARNTITHWMKRGWLKPIGRLGQTLLFRPVDVLNADAQARRDARRSHRRRPIDGIVVV